jgi:hypothetical protein
MKNIHVLPTDKPSRLVLDDTTQHLMLINKGEALWGNQHIYITSDEEIKEGDWFYNTFNDNQAKIQKRKGHWKTCFNQRKIILTTDPDLIADGVQAIDDEFLEWFVKNPSCEEVVVTKGSYKLSPMEEMLEKEYVPKGTFDTYKIIIPKEELIDCEYCGGDGIYVDGDNNTSKCTMCEKGKVPKEKPTEEAKQRAKNYMSLKGALEPKKTTLEEAAERFLIRQGCQRMDCDGENCNFFEDVQPKDLIEFAKYQADKMYSEEEVEQIARFGFNAGRRVELKAVDLDFTFEKWFEQFKKKQQ